LVMPLFIFVPWAACFCGFVIALRAATRISIYQTIIATLLPLVGSISCCATAFLTRILTVTIFTIIPAFAITCAILAALIIITASSVITTCPFATGTIATLAIAAL